jgi:hypothetical protein
VSAPTTIRAASPGQISRPRIKGVAKGFYADLLGWEYEDSPVGEDSYYTMARVDGRNVAAIAPQPQAQRDGGAPARWNSYVTVRSADATLKRATQLGGSAHTSAFDVMQAGRMAVLRDPHGAHFMVWEPRENIGAALVNSPGALCWNELTSPSFEASSSFYGDLFGWSFAPFEGSPEPYLTISNAGKANGGIRPQSPPGIPPHWLVYFAVIGIEPVLGKVAELGGSTLAGPIDLPMARIAVVKDAQGAAFGLYDGTLEP